MPVSTDTIRGANAIPATPRIRPQDPPAIDQVWRNLDTEPQDQNSRGGGSLRDRVMLNTASNNAPILTEATTVERALQMGAPPPSSSVREEIERGLEADGPAITLVEHLAGDLDAASNTSSPGLLGAMREQAPQPAAGAARVARARGSGRRPSRGDVPPMQVRRTARGRGSFGSTGNSTPHVGQNARPEINSFGAAYARAMERSQREEESTTTLERPER